MVVHAVRQGVFPVFHRRVGGHRQDRQFFEALVLPEPGGGGKTVHHRHLQVHQYTLIGLFIEHVDGFLAVVGNVDPESGLFQQFTGYLLVDLVVFYQQDLGTLHRAQALHVDLPVGMCCLHAPGLNAKGCHHRIEQVRGTDRLGQELVDVFTTGFVHHITGAEAGDHHDVRIGLREDLGLDPARNFIALHAWHEPVQHHQVVIFFHSFHQLEQLVGIGRFIHPEGEGLQVNSQDLPRRRVVVHHDGVQVLQVRHSGKRFLLGALANTEPDGKVEGAANPRFAIDTDMATHQFH